MKMENYVEHFSIFVYIALQIELKVHCFQALCHFLVVWFGASYLIFLNLNSSIYKMVLISEPVSNLVMKMKGDNA